jgi:hypothetical protein
MTRPRPFPATVLLAGILTLSACASPAVYKPEVEAFQNATAQTSAFMEAKRTSIRDIRTELRTEVLTAKKPELRLSTKCSSVVSKYQTLSGSGARPSLTAADVSGCEIELVDRELSHLDILMNPPKVLDNSAAFVASVSAYAASLSKVATAGDQQSFVAAVNDLANSATSVANSAAKAAKKDPPDLEALTPIGNLVALAVSYYLENRRAEALEAGAKAAQPWIVQGSAGVARAMYAAQFEIVRSKRDELFNQLDKVNEENDAGYVAAADKAIAVGVDLRRELAADPGAPFRALPVAHENLLAAFGDRERLLAASIAASKELFEAAKDAKNALVKD